MQTLRGYQTDCVSAVMNSIRGGRRRILYTLATGLGKTTVMAELIRQLLDNGEKVLCIVHRKEIVVQIYDRITEHCELSPYVEIGIEQNIERAMPSCKVVVGNVATVKSNKRLDWFKPTIIITDEAHRSAAKSYRSVYARFGVPDTCIHIGCTATAKRTDRQSLYAIHIDGSPVIITDKKGKKHEASIEESVFEQHVYERNILEGTNDGYLVPAIGWSVETDTDISDVKTASDGDFDDDDLQRVVNTDTRNQKIISGWIDKGCNNRSTIMFTAGVDHAHSLAKDFRKAGFIAASVCGDTEDEERARIISDFKYGKLQVLTNDDVVSEGTDMPIASCIGHAKPTKSWNKYVQKTGRGLRVLPGVVDHLDDPDERCAAIEWSDKPDCIVLDYVDICGKHDLCTLPVILDLPAKLDLQGKSVTEAKRMIDDFGDAVDHLADDNKDLPMTFQKLQVRLAQIDLIRNAKDHGTGWKVSDDGFRFMNLPPGYTAELIPAGENQYRLFVKFKDECLKDKTGAPLKDFKRYLNTAAWHAEQAVTGHREVIAAQRRFEVCMPFGAHEGIPIKEITLGYLRWAYNGMDALKKPYYSKVREAIKSRITPLEMDFGDD